MQMEYEKRRALTEVIYLLFVFLTHQLDFIQDEKDRINDRYRQ